MGKKHTADPKGIAEANRGISRRGDRRGKSASSLTPAKEQNAAISHTGIAQTGERGEDGSETETALKRAADNEKKRAG